MRKIIMFAAVLFACAVSAKAQDAYPTAEIFGGYSYLNIEGENTLGIDRQGLHGAGFSFAGNVTKHIGIVGDFSAHLKNGIEVGPFDVDVTAFYFLVGPRFSWRGDKATVFGHGLIGGARAKTSASGFGDESQTDFALGFGGGLDLNANRSISIRIVQADYLPTRVDDFGGDKRWSHNFRVQAGVVFKLGAD